MKVKLPVKVAVKRKPPLAKKSVASRRGSYSHEVRIIGGIWKRTKLKVADRTGLRPTPDRVRETLFNWLGQDLQGMRCLDAFAGTGALGFESASRGAKAVTLVENDSLLITQLQQTQQQLNAQQMRVVRGDGVAAIAQSATASWQLIFIDPPFDSAYFEPALQASRQALAPGGFVYLEAPKAWTDAELETMGWAVHRYLKAGAVHAHLLKAAVIG